jgi:hypothetical protein
VKSSAKSLTDASGAKKIISVLPFFRSSVLPFFPPSRRRYGGQAALLP